MHIGYRYTYYIVVGVGGGLISIVDHIVMTIVLSITTTSYGWKPVTHVQLLCQVSEANCIVFNVIVLLLLLLVQSQS
jgi:hypothetical protein